MNHRAVLIWASSMSIILCGCWDQRLLKDHTLVLTVGYDQTDDEKILNTVSYPVNKAGIQQNGVSNESSKVISSQGETVRDAEVHMDKIIPEKFDMSKAKVILFGEELAAHGVFPVLDSTYRDLRGPLNAKVAIVDGKAKDALNFKEEDSILISQFFAELLRSAERGGITKNENVQAICPIILSEGKDVVLPYIGLSDQKEEAVKVEGLALFNDDKFTGRLGLQESGMLLILQDNRTKALSLNLNVNDHEKNNEKKFVNVVVRKIKRKIKINTNNNQIRAKIKINLKLDIDEYASNKLSSEKEVKVLSKKVEKALNELAKETLNKMQEANSDALGLGERVKAYHHPVWKKIDWNKAYPEIPIETTFNVEIVQHGIIN
ncbi:Ger(x)C family spore germination protein [Siminovitchia acidinfaciens]|uniref:Ger(X)C family spore germination protein n=1 Tax=Siminovitchia acidinfaciens TaxID=2321395 RepID=A0A429XU26_9BACI|nr:Ger(x)C family spore germination protein [Siminovitchia acidinfaciens]RST71251.1 Ger(x)C family spore germination protein [Siminovitchia acidinfaciens]